jgi:hypothetical protein
VLRARRLPSGRICYLLSDIVEAEATAWPIIPSLYEAEVIIYKNGSDLCDLLSGREKAMFTDRRFSDITR